MPSSSVSDYSADAAAAEAKKLRKLEKKEKKEKRERSEESREAKKEKKEKKEKRDKRDSDDEAEKERDRSLKRAKIDDKQKEIKEKTKEKIEVKESDSTSDYPSISSFRVPDEIIKRLEAKKITKMFPIQSSSFDLIYDGNDVVGRAATGSGKTLAFSLPICIKLQEMDKAAKEKLRVGRSPRVICLTPTRELAKQVSETFEWVSPNLTTLVVYGGSPYGPMEAALRRGVDVLVGTCGRVYDLIEKGTLKLSAVRHIILDEADEMLDMGFAEDIEKILSHVPRNDENPSLQTLLFSATLPSWVEGVARKYLRPDKKTIDLVGSSKQRASTDVTHLAISCHWQERNSVLKEVIQAYAGAKARTIVFTETKKDANEMLTGSSISSISQVLHGDIAQAQRESTLKAFREGKFQALIATDVAARGIDIPGVELVIQIEPPQSTETYIHRAGRTGRAGAKGVAITFYTPKQQFWIGQIERQARITFKRVGVPQRDDILNSAADEATKTIQSVSEKVLPAFQAHAEKLLEEFDGNAVHVLSRALAAVTGHLQPLKARSLLQSAAGQVTVQLTTNIEIRSLSFVWSLIRKYLFSGNPEDADANVRGMRLTADKKGAVFDVPAEMEDTVKNLDTKDSRTKFEVCKQLPALVQLDVPRPERRFFGKGRDRDSRGGSSGGGGRSFGGRPGGSFGRR